MAWPILAAAAVAALASPALSAPRSFKASITAASPLPAVPSGRVAATEIPPLPGYTVSTRGPLLSVPDPSPPPAAEAPLPPPNPYRTEGCPVSGG